MVGLRFFNTDQELSHNYWKVWTQFKKKFDVAEDNTSESHGPRTLLMAPAQQQEETILVEGTGVVPAKCSPKIKSELFSLL